MKKDAAFLLLRVSLGIVFLAFGIGKLENDIWAQTMRAMAFFLNLPWNVSVSVLIVGLLEIITGAALISGLFSRFFASLASLQLIGILVLLKFQEIRDVGLLGAAIFLAFTEYNVWGVDWFLTKRKERAL
ncbi:MAG: DoxX family protein [Candidatus Omnitrophica bacterium]|nr:DoxX family protein [Candidatus Omnitrophota bacterium]